MRRGTTPTLEVEVKGVEVKELASIFLTIKQGTKELTIRETDIEIDEEKNMLLAPLKQQETLAFSDGYVNIQLRATLKVDGAEGEDIPEEEIPKIASDVVTLPIEHILKEGMIE